ncbi:hypothetical protein F5141DRAFT_1203538 [Pisolithus sp. B1]|nr:hypothetical protein F5141DRAFT_1203538 [Pisolithus sp. B1]
MWYTQFDDVEERPTGYSLEDGRSCVQKEDTFASVLSISTDCVFNADGTDRAGRYWPMTRSTRLTRRLVRRSGCRRWWQVALIFAIFAPVNVFYRISWFTVPCMLRVVLVRVSMRPSQMQVLDVAGVTEKTGPQQDDAQKSEERKVAVWVSGWKRPCGIPFGVEDHLRAPTYIRASSTLVVTTMLAPNFDLPYLHVHILNVDPIQSL